MCLYVYMHVCLYVWGRGTRFRLAFHWASRRPWVSHVTNHLAFFMGKISTGPAVPLQPRARVTWKIPKHSPKFFTVSLDRIWCGLVLLCSHGEPSDLRTSIWAVLVGFTFGNPKSTHSGLIWIILTTVSAHPGTCALGETPPLTPPEQRAGRDGAGPSGRWGRGGAGRGGPCRRPGSCEEQRRGRRVEPGPSPSARRHALGLLRHREPLGRLPGGPGSPQQRLLRGRTQCGPARLPALHHLSHPLHR